MELSDANKSYGSSKKNKNAAAEESFTVDKAIDAFGFGKFQIKLSILTGLAWMADGMETIILSFLFPALHCDWMITSWKQAMITTVVLCGMLISSSIWGSIADKYGRKPVIVLMSATIFYFGILSALAPTFTWLLVLRFLVGFGIGGIPQPITLYAEFLPSTHRAKCIVFIQVFWSIGTLFEVLLALFIMPILGWRWLLGLSACPLLICLLMCYDAQFGRIVDLFVPGLQITTLMLWYLWMTVVFCYFGIILFTTQLLEMGDPCHGGTSGTVSAENENPGCPLECHSLETNDYLAILWTTAAEFPGVLFTIFAVEYLGRKKTISLELGMFSVFFFLLFMCLNRTWLTIFSSFARMFILGCFMALYVYTPEIYPTVNRGIGVGSCNGFAHLGALISPFVAQVGANVSVDLPIAVYGVSSLVAAVIALLLPIETKGKSLKVSINRVYHKCTTGPITNCILKQRAVHKECHLKNETKNHTVMPRVYCNATTHFDCLTTAGVIQGEMRTWGSFTN